MQQVCKKSAHICTDSVLRILKNGLFSYICIYVHYNMKKGERWLPAYNLNGGNLVESRVPPFFNKFLFVI